MTKLNLCRMPSSMTNSKSRVKLYNLPGTEAPNTRVTVSANSMHKSASLLLLTNQYKVVLSS